MLRWLISETRLEERLESGTGRSSAIVITVGNSTEASTLCAKGLRFGGTLKVVEKYLGSWARFSLYELCRGRPQLPGRMRM